MKAFLAILLGVVAIFCVGMLVGVKIARSGYNDIK